MERFAYKGREVDGLSAKPKKPASAEEIKKRKLQREVREILKDSAKEKAGRGGISPGVKREINKVTRTNPS